MEENRVCPECEQLVPRDVPQFKTKGNKIYHEGCAKEIAQLWMNQTFKQGLERKEEPTFGKAKDNEVGKSVAEKKSSNKRKSRRPNTRRGGNKRAPAKGERAVQNA